jgi:hypothetical protein
MINAAGKQAIKNGGPQVTNSFPEGALDVPASPQVAKYERQTRPARAFQAEK